MLHGVSTNDSAFSQKGTASEGRRNVLRRRGGGRRRTTGASKQCRAHGGQATTDFEEGSRQYKNRVSGRLVGSTLFQGDRRLVSYSLRRQQRNTYFNGEKVSVLKTEGVKAYIAGWVVWFLPKPQKTA